MTHLTPKEVAKQFHVPWHVQWIRNRGAVLGRAASPEGDFRIRAMIGERAADVVCKTVRELGIDADGYSFDWTPDQARRILTALPAPTMDETRYHDAVMPGGFISPTNPRGIGQDAPAAPPSGPAE